MSEDVLIWIVVVVTLTVTGYVAYLADRREALRRGVDPPDFTGWGLQGGLVGWWYRRSGRTPPWWATWRAPAEVPAWARPAAAEPAPPPAAPTPAPSEASAPEAAPASLAPPPSAAAVATTVAEPVLAAPPVSKGGATTVADPGRLSGAPTTVTGGARTGAPGTTRIDGPTPASPEGVPAWARATLEVALGDRYGDYGLLGAGGMGVVVRGVDRKLDRPVAIKLPPPQLAAHPQFRERFLREAKAQARLTHAAIGRVLDVPDVPAGEIPVMVLEFLEGEDLAARLTRLGPEPVDVVTARVAAAAAGLAHAHSRGVLHRDVKPANLMLVEGEVRVLDFGLAALEGSEKLTSTGLVMGSLPYMPPEQLRGEPVDAAADQFSLAATAHELLTGALPFSLDDRGHTAPSDAARVRAGISAGLAAVLKQGMAADPAARYPDLEAFRAALVEAG